jgi:hypothetical protein
MHLGDHDAAPTRRPQRPERGGDRRLADAALAGDEEQAVVEQADRRYSSPSQ